MAFGDRVPFASENVCGYAYSSSELGYDPETPCFLLKRVAEADDPPPLLLFNDDGQWEAHAEQESDEELADSDSVLVWSLGYLTDRFSGDRGRGPRRLRPPRFHAPQAARHVVAVADRWLRSH